MSKYTSKSKEDDKDIKDVRNRSSKGKPNGKSRSKYSGKSTSASKPESKGRDFICSAGSPTNDPRWYLNNPFLSRDVASLWFSKPIGTRLVHSAIQGGIVPTTLGDTYEPGILSIPTITTWGGTSETNGPYSGTVNNAINLTAQKLYQYVVHANSRNISYDKKDLIMSMMAIDSVYQVITEAIRAYRLIATYDPQNQYVDKLLYAMHWDSQDLRTNMSQFRYMINWAISRVNKFFMPAIFDVVKAHISCYEHVYTDRPSNKAQFIVKWSAGAWVYDDVEGALQYCASWQKLDSQSTTSWYSSSSLRTKFVFEDVVSDLIARIENSQYIGVMQGDLLKAFGMERMSQYAFVGLDIPLLPVYDEEFLLKLHNADILPATPNATFDTHGNYISSIIYRDVDTVNGNIRCVRSKQWTPTGFDVVRMAEGVMVDLPTGISATPENIMLMNLYKMPAEYSTTTKWFLSDTSSTSYFEGFIPPEVMLQATIFFDPKDMSNRQIGFHTYAATLYTAGLISRFRMHPLLTKTYAVTDSTDPIIWETDNVTTVEYRQLIRILDVVFWSLWASSEISSSEEVRDART